MSHKYNNRICTDAQLSPCIVIMTFGAIIIMSVHFNVRVVVINVNYT